MKKVPSRQSPRFWWGLAFANLGAGAAFMYSGDKPLGIFLGIVAFISGIRAATAPMKFVPDDSRDDDQKD